MSACGWASSSGKCRKMKRILLGNRSSRSFGVVVRDFAARALEIAVFEQGDPRVLGAQEVIGGLGRHRQADRMRL